MFLTASATLGWFKTWIWMEAGSSWSQSAATNLKGQIIIVMKLSGRFFLTYFKDFSGFQYCLKLIRITARASSISSSYWVLSTMATVSILISSIFLTVGNCGCGTRRPTSRSCLEWPCPCRHWSYGMEHLHIASWGSMRRIFVFSPYPVALARSISLVMILSSDILYRGLALYRLYFVNWDYKRGALLE